MIARILSLAEDDIIKELPCQVVSSGVPLIFIPLKDLEACSRVKVRLDLLDALLDKDDPKELFVFTLETVKPTSHVHCRMFAPMFGITEDPATGGAHGPLGAYLVQNGLSDGSQILSEQGYEMGRPSSIQVEVTHQSKHITDVRVGGTCVPMGKGKLLI